MDLHTVWTSLATSTITTGVLVVTLLRGATPRFLDRMLGHYLDARSAGEQARRERELESLRADLSHLQDRGRRSNEQEYQAIVAAWEAVNEAFYEVTTTIMEIPGKPKFEHLDEDALRKRLEEDQFTPHEIRFVSSAPDRGGAYQEVERTRRINASSTSLWSASQTVRRGSIFMPSALLSHFERTLLRIRAAQTEQFLSHRGSRAVGIEATTFMLEPAAQTMLQELRDAVRARLLHVDRGSSTVADGEPVEQD